jgi:hypothetical protein
MNNELIKINDDSLRLARVSIPERTEKQLYFSNSLPITLNRGLSFSIQFNTTFKKSIKLDIDDLDSFSHNLDEIKKNFTTELDIQNQIAEPSLIYLPLPIKKPVDASLVEKPSYYPIYGLFSPEQRWIYLNWLSDITKPAEKYYVYLYYYCLERRLCESINKELVEEIFLLANSHVYLKSQAYLGLFYSYFYCKEEYILEKLGKWHNEIPANNIKLYYYFNKGIDLTSKEIYEILYQNLEINKRYLKLQPQLYLEFIDKYLEENYGECSLKFYEKFKMTDFKETFVYFLFNKSLPDSIRKLKVYDIIGSKKFTNFLTSLHAYIHKKIKSYLRSNKN